MFLEPTPTPYDLRFRLFGIPVRVHPAFWLFSAIFGWGYLRAGAGFLLLWIGCTFLSILVHEVGHVIMGLLCKRPGHIVLYHFGGLAIGHYQTTRRWQRIAISLAGPAAGFLLYGLVWVLFYHLILPQLILPAVMDQDVRPAWDYLFAGAQMLLFMNLFWNLLNLVPVWPLDGGQVAHEVITGINPRTGVRWAFGVSFVVAGLIAVASVMAANERHVPYYPAQLDPTFAAIMFGLLAVQNYQAMQMVERRPSDEMENW